MKAQINTRILFLISSILIVLVVPFVYGMRFYNTDDILIRNMLTGSIQFNQSPYVNFFPAWFANIYIFFYNHFPHIEWYFVAYYACISLVFIILLSVIYTRDFRKNALAFALFICYFVIYGKLIVTEVHFTILSGMLSLAACILFLQHGLKKWSWLALAALVLFLGMLYRYQNAVLVVACFFIIYFLSQFAKSRSFQRPSKALIYKALLFVLLPLCIVVISHKMVPKEIKDLGKTSASFLSIFDYKVLENKETRNIALNKAGWDSVELNIFNWYIIPNNPAFAAEKIVTLASVAKGKSREINVKKLLKGAAGFFTNMEFGFPLIFLVLICTFIIAEERKRVLLFSVFSLLFIFILLILLKLTFKFPALYIMIPIFSAYLFFLFWHIIHHTNNLIAKRNILIIIPLLFVGIIVKKNQSEFIDWVRYYVPNKKQVTYHSDKKYAVCLAMLNHDYAYPDYYLGNFYKRLQMENIYYLGPMIYHPASKLIDKNNNEDILKWLVGNKDAAMLFNHKYEDQIEYVMPDILRYLKKMYHLNVKYNKNNFTKTECELSLYEFTDRDEAGIPRIKK